jgi:SpoVK/Ycf46/Vps4 family AAA+-type ATPase
MRIPQRPTNPGAVGMRSFHVDGLAAFWARHSLFDAYRQRRSATSDAPPPAPPPLTGALPDKLRGLSASLDVARRSSPCVLHVAGIDRELSAVGGHSADPDARAEEERRMLEAIRGAVGGPTSVVVWKGSRNIGVAPGGVAAVERNARVACDTVLSHLTTPQVIIILSTSVPLPPGPLASSLLQRSIAISPPDVNYARVLWDDDADGTFDSLSPYLVGMSAREIGYLRQKFSPRWEEAMKNAIGDGPATTADDRPRRPPSSVEVLQSLLPDLETARSFAQLSGKSGGSSTLPLSSSSLPDVRWEDIGGLEAIRREIMDAVELPLKYPALFEGSRRSGILLFGPPGTGKTLVAKAIAREAGLPFLSVKGPELLGSYVGESEANIRAVFDAARSAALNPRTSPLKGMMAAGGGGGGYSGASVLFFDEFDSLAPRRGEIGHGDGVMDRVVATLLGELDGAGGVSKGNSYHPAHVVVIAATNRPDLLDPSLLRPGRLDRLLYLGPAKTREHCLKILLAQTRKFRFEQGCGAAAVLERAMESFPPTLSGADLSAVASGALMRGLKRVCDRIEEEACSINSERGVGGDSELAVDIDDVMDSWSKDKLQPVMTAEDFIEAAKDIVSSISPTDLQRFENLKQLFSSGQFDSDRF